MALELVLTLQAVNADCDQLTLVDDTIYGGTEPDRTDLAVLLFGYKKGLPTEEDIPLTITYSNPLTDSTWYSECNADGWHSFHMYAIPLYDAGETYQLDDCVYHLTVVWKCLAAISGVEPGTNPSYWEQVADVDVEDTLEAAGNVIYDYFSYIITCRSEKCYSKVVVAATNEGCCEGCNDAELKQTYEKLDVLLNAAYVLCTQLKYAEAEEVVRNMIQICEKSKCICD